MPRLPRRRRDTAVLFRYTLFYWLVRFGHVRQRDRFHCLSVGWVHLEGEERHVPRDVPCILCHTRRRRDTSIVFDTVWVASLRAGGEVRHTLSQATCALYCAILVVDETYSCSHPCRAVLVVDGTLLCS